MRTQIYGLVAATTSACSFVDVDRDLFRCGTDLDCGGGYQCVRGLCRKAGSCTCAARGKDCGVIPDGCGGTVDCGQCAPPQSCGGGGTANVCGCTPDNAAACQGKCGGVTNNCGQTVECGGCAPPLSCGGGGTPNVCGCTLESDSQFCVRLGKDCESVSAPDNCGSPRTVDCGDCTAPESCGGGGTTNACGCAAENDGEFCSRLGKDCDPVTAPDSCGNSRTVHCGSCSFPYTCGGGGSPNECGSRAWAQWPMPDSPTTFCTDGSSAASCPSQAQPAYGQDGNYEINAPRYSTTAETVTDEVTGLMWQRAVPLETFAWAAAQAFCESLSLGGHADWRIPSRVELISLFDLGRIDPAIDVAAFPDTPGELFWAGADAAWRVSFFHGGHAITSDPAQSHRVRCVR